MQELINKQTEHKKADLNQVNSEENSVKSSSTNELDHLQLKADNSIQVQQLYQMQEKANTNTLGLPDNNINESENISEHNSETELDNNIDVNFQDINSSEGIVDPTVTQRVPFQKGVFDLDLTTDSSNETEDPEVLDPTEAEDEKEVDKSDKNEIEGEIFNTGIKYKGSYHRELKEGEIEFEGPDEIFKAKASLKEKSENLIEVHALGTATLSTPDFSGTMPLMRVPLGIPGVYAAIDLEYGASSTVIGQVGFKFNLDSKNLSPSKFEIENTNINASAEASIGVFGGVAAGVPAVGEVSIGGKGSAVATLESELELDNDMHISGKMEGAAIGKLEAVAKAKLLWYTKSASITIVEGTLGKFEKEFGPIPLSADGIRSLTSISSYRCTRDKGDKASAKSKAEQNSEDDPDE